MARTKEPMVYQDKEKFSLKDHLFNERTVEHLLSELHQAYPQFDLKETLQSIVKQFPQLELKQRIVCIGDVLSTILPQDYPQAIVVVLRALPQALDPNKTDNDFGEFIYEVYNHYIAQYGVKYPQYVTTSLDALEQTTQRFSAEFAIRLFINHYPDQTLARMIMWSQHPNYHVRRLSCEGSRPSLPWGGKIDIDDSVRLQILDNLYSDPTRYVVRSVANHLNDLSKTNLGLVIATLGRWKESGRQDKAEMMWLMRHALRTAVKDGQSEALQILGYSPTHMHTVSDMEYTKQVGMGENFEFSCMVQSQQDGPLMIDYKIYFLKKDGSHKAKVFKIKDTVVTKGQEIIVKKKQAFRPMTTRVLYPGTHYITLQINGVEQERHTFDLLI